MSYTPDVFGLPSLCTPIACEEIRQYGDVIKANRQKTSAQNEEIDKSGLSVILYRGFGN